MANKKAVRQSPHPRDLAQDRLDARDYAPVPDGAPRCVSVGGFVPGMVAVVTLDLSARNATGSRYVRNSPGGISAVIQIPSDILPDPPPHIQIGVRWQ